MEKRIAVIAIIVENRESAAEVQTLLTNYGEYIIGRMGIPYPQKDIHVISVVIDAEADTINALTGKIGKLSGVNAKTVYSNL